MKRNDKLAVSYARYSSVAQQNGYSIQAQQAAIEQYAKANNITIVRQFVDEAKTGTTDRRDELHEMMKFLCDNDDIELLLCHKRDRLFRNRRQMNRYLSELDDLGVEFLAVAQQYGNKKEGILLDAINDGMAEFYSANLAEEVMKSLILLAKECRHTGGNPPFGLSVAPDKSYEINSLEAPIVRELFERYASGESLNAIQKSFSEKGYTTRSGKPWSKCGMHDLLRNEKMCGTYIYNRRVSKSSKGHCNSHKSKADDDIVRVPNGIPAIVDQETFKKVQERMDKNKHKAGAFKAKQPYLLTGKIKCGICGYRYQGNSRSGKNSRVYTSYRCGNREQTKTCTNPEIERTHLEKYIVEKLKKLLFQKEIMNQVKKHLVAYRKSCDESANETLKQQQKRLSGIEKQIQNLTFAISQGMFSPSMKEKMNELETAKEKTAAEIAQYKRQNSIIEITDEELAVAMNQLDSYILENSDSYEVQKFIDQFVEQITVYPTYIEVTLVVASFSFGHKFVLIVSVLRDEIMKRHRNFNYSIPSKNRVLFKLM